MRKLIAIITARSGSKGLKDKNIKSLNGKPLLAYSVEAANKSGVFDTVHVSTDSQEYAEVAKSYGADEPFLRDVQNSGDASGQNPPGIYRIYFPSEKRRQMDRRLFC